MSSGVTMREPLRSVVPVRTEATPGRATVLWAVAIVAFAVRYLPTALTHGWLGLGRYDDGVYLGMAISLLHGEVPYRDLVMLHPPGILAGLLPFALLAEPFGDSVALVSAKVAFMAAGAATSVLVANLVRDRGPRAMAAAGGTYAVFAPAVYAETSTTLEAFSNLLVALALTVVVRAAGPSPRSSWAVGALLGVAAATKVWGVVPLLVVVLVVAHRHGTRPARRVVAGAAAALTALCLPFFVMAPWPMWRMVVLDQIGRAGDGEGVVARVPQLFGIPRYEGHGGPYTQALAFVVFAVVLTVLTVVVVRAARCRVALPAGLLVASVGMLVLSPGHFLQYGAFVAVPLAWCIGLAVREGRTTALLSVLLAVSAVASVTRGPGTVLTPQFTAAVRAVDGCLTSDDPTVLIATDTLTRNLERGCVTWIDVTGLAYDHPWVKGSNGVHHSRSGNGAWSEMIGTYLESGDAIVVGRPSTAVNLDQLFYWRMATTTTTSSGYRLHVWRCADGSRAIPHGQWRMAQTEGLDAALAQVNNPCTHIDQ